MLLAAFWVLLGAFLVLLGAFWVPFGCFLGLLGYLWAPLGASWGDLGPLGAILGFQVEFVDDFGSQKGAKREPTWHQNRTQNEPKSKTNFDIEKDALEDRLGAVLG